MRFSTLLAACWLAAAAAGAAQAAPPGYRAPHRRYNAHHQAYVRTPGRLTFSGNLAYYNGDVTNRLSDNTLRPGYGIGFTQPLSPRLTFASELSAVYLKAKDFYPTRGYSFDSNNGLLTATLRYNIIEDKNLFTSVHHAETPLVVFAEAGVGAMLYSPTAYLDNGLFGRLQLPSETNNRYPALAGVLPIGIGATLRASRSVYFTLDALYYFTTTDLLDDISQRGNPKQPDNFATLALKVEFAFHKKKPRPLVHAD